MIGRLLARLFRNRAKDARAESVASVTEIVQRFLNGDLRRLSDRELAVLLEHLLGEPAIKKSLRGNARFMGSLALSYRRNGRLSLKQRQGLYNVLERALPHNLVAGLLRPR